MLSDRCCKFSEVGGGGPPPHLHTYDHNDITICISTLWVRQEKWNKQPSTSQKNTGKECPNFWRSFLKIQGEKVISIWRKKQSDFFFEKLSSLFNSFWKRRSCICTFSVTIFVGKRHNFCSEKWFRKNHATFNMFWHKNCAFPQNLC